MTRLATRLAATQQQEAGEESRLGAQAVADARDVNDGKAVFLLYKGAGNPSDHSSIIEDCNFVSN